MLGTGARYAEYGITGGFFLFTQALFFGLVAFPEVSWLSAAYSFGRAASEVEVPEVARPAIQSLLVALTLLSVFIIGLVLEIIGSIFMVYEAHVFRKRLAMNQWVAKFIEAELPDYAEDYRVFLDLADLWSQWKEQWKPKNWFRRRQFTWSTQVHQRFRRLESALIAKVLMSGAKIEMLVEQISISRMSRALGTTLYVVGFEFWGPGAAQVQDDLDLAIIIRIIGTLFLVSATLLTLGAYSRFVNMLLSLVYAGWKPPTAPVAESRREQSES